MENKVTIIRQLLDSQISVTINQAFAVVSMEFTTHDGGRAHVELDMESAINVMGAMDDGPKAAEAMSRPILWPRIAAALSGFLANEFLYFIFR